MPNTRSASRRQASKRKVPVRVDTTTSGDDSNNSIRNHESTEPGAGMSMEHLREARSGVEKLRTQIRSLEQENGNLRTELRQAQQNVHRGGRSSSREKAYQRQIQSLERTITSLKTAREKDRRSIEKLRNAEVEQDAKELADDDVAVPTRQTADLGESAINLLRRMCDTIDMNSLAEGEECAVCMEEMAVGKCYSLLCRHPVCAGCFERLGDGPNATFDHQTASVQCPHCREICPRDECEIITHTAVQQWDILLDISRQWAAMDVGEIGNEDDGKDSFLDDGSVAAIESRRYPETLGEAASLDSETSATPTSPNDAGPVAYKCLPSPLKRKRLKELAAQRAVKQRV